MLPRLSIGLALWLALFSCKDGVEHTSSTSVDGRLATDDLVVKKLTVHDLSESGSPFRNLAPPTETALRDDAAEFHIKTSPDGAGKLLIEVANFCTPDECFIGARATMSLKQEDGTALRFRASRQELLEGLQYKPTLKRLGPRLVKAMVRWTEGLRAKEKTLRAWLSSSDIDAREAALQAMMDRNLRGLAPDIAPLLTDPEPGIRTRAVAVAGTFQHPDLIPGLEKIALAGEESLALIALEALMDYTSPKATIAIEKIGHQSTFSGVKGRANTYMKARVKAGSSATPISDTKNH